MPWFEMRGRQSAPRTARCPVIGRYRCWVAAVLVAGVLAPVSLTGCDEQESYSNAADKKSQAASEDEYPGLEWSKKRVAGDDGTEYSVVNLNDERLRIPRKTVNISPRGPYIHAMLAWTWPGLETMDTFGELEAKGERFAVIRVRFEALKDPQTPFRDTIYYMHNWVDQRPPIEVKRWETNPALIRHHFHGKTAFYQVIDPPLLLPSGNPVMASCGWLHEEDGVGSCEVTMEWSEEVGVQYQFTDHDILKEFVPVHRAVTDFIESVHADTDTRKE
jgi:hypothetical protein